MHEELAFGGRAGQVVARAVSPLSLLTGAAVGGALIFLGFLTTKLGITALSPFLARLFISFVAAYFAVDEFRDQWKRGGRLVPFGEVAPVALRDFLLACCWMVPLWIAGSRPQETLDVLIGFATGAGDKAAILVLLFFGGVLISPPILLVVAVSAERHTEIVSPSHWGRTFGGRFFDLYLVYVIYMGAMLTVILALSPVLLLAASAGRGPFTTAALASGAFAVGVAVTLLGGLCGAFSRTEDPQAAAPKSIPSLNPILAAAIPPRAAQSSSGRSTQDSPAGTREPAAGSTAAVPPAGPTRTPLLDAQKRVEAIVKEHASDPTAAIRRLEQLRREYAPNPTVLYALGMTLLQNGRADDALVVASEAIPVCLKSGSVIAAARLTEALVAAGRSPGVSREQIVSFAEAFRASKDPLRARTLYLVAIAADASDMRLIKGALAVAQDLLAADKVDASLELYEVLLARCGDSPLAEFILSGKSAAERKARPAP